MIEPAHWYGYCLDSHSWEKSYEHPPFPVSTKLTFIALNVLFQPNLIFDLVLRSRERYDHQLFLLRQSNAHIICLNEVIPSYYEYIKNQPWVQKNYYITDLVLGDSHMGNIILSQFPFSSVYVHIFSKQVKCPRPIMIGLINNTHLNILVASVHITALSHNFNKRRIQLVELNHSMQSHPKLAPIKSKILLGDFNLHIPFEDVLISDLDYMDLWNETHKDETGTLAAGYTYDSAYNRLIWAIFFGQQARRMRLDRIIASVGGYFHPTGEPMKLFANQRIPNRWYLFPSDHFGLTVTLNYEDGVPCVPSNQKAAENQRNNHKIVRYYPLHFFNWTMRIILFSYVVYVVIQHFLPKY